MVPSYLYYCLKLPQEKKGRNKVYSKVIIYLLMSNDACDGGDLDFTAFISITSQLFIYSHHRKCKDRSTCSDISREDLWSTQPAHSPHYSSPLPPLGRLLTMIVFATQEKLFIFFTFSKASVNSGPQSVPICFIYKI